jgi:hypothetical protein
LGNAGSRHAPMSTMRVKHIYLCQKLLAPAIHHSPLAKACPASSHFEIGLGQIAQKSRTWAPLPRISVISREMRAPLIIWCGKTNLAGGLGGVLFLEREEIGNHFFFSISVADGFPSFPRRTGRARQSTPTFSVPGRLPRWGLRKGLGRLVRGYFRPFPRRG